MLYEVITFLEAYNATNDEYYYQAAEKAAAAVIWGQSNEGGWNYMVDFAGDRSMKQWYATIVITSYSIHYTKLYDQHTSTARLIILLEIRLTLLV